MHSTVTSRARPDSQGSDELNVMRKEPADRGPVREHNEDDMVHIKRIIEIIKLCCVILELLLFLIYVNGRIVSG